MNVKQIMGLTGAICVSGDPDSPTDFRYGFAADLMSDVLTLDTEQMLLLTGLSNIQTIRTAEMADVKCILFVRGKKVTPDMVELAEQNGITLLESPYSMFRAVGELAKNGVDAIF